MMDNQTPPNNATIPIRILTHNIRTIPWIRLPPEKSWATRKEYITSQMNIHTLRNPESLICMQEVLQRQLDDILHDLNANDSWKHVGCGRDGGQKGEYSPILYRSDIWESEWSETRWLSETPHKPSRGWDAAYRRVLTGAVLRHRKFNRRVLAMNTHLDNRGKRSRFEGARKVLQWAREWIGDPVWQGSIEGLFLCGDFNTDSRDGQDAYGVLTGPDSLFTDSMALSKDEKQLKENNFSWTGFNDKPKDDMLIDYILLGPRKERECPWNVQTYDILPNRSDDGVYSSDHRAVVVDAELTGSQG